MAAGNVCEMKSVIGFKRMDPVAPFASPSGDDHKTFQLVGRVILISN